MNPVIVMRNFAGVLFLFVVFFYESSTALKLPSYIKPCSRSDPKLNECALKNGREAIPKVLKGDAKYRVPNLLPLEVDEIVVGDGPTSGIGLRMSCKKCKLYGIDKTNLDDIKIDMKNQHIHLELSNPKLDLKGKYTASGKVLVLPITGDGDADIGLSDVKLNYDSEYVMEKKNGKDHIKLTKPKLQFTTSNMTFKLTNLFNGDKLLGDNMNQFLNENWPEVLKEFGPAVSETLSQVLTIIVNNIAELVPADEIFVK